MKKKDLIGKVEEEKSLTRCISSFQSCPARLATDRSICILTRPVVITGFNRSLLVDWWSIGRLKKNMVDVKILSISYPILLDSRNRLKIVSI